MLKRTTIVLPEEILQTLKILSAAKNKSMSEIIREAIYEKTRTKQTIVKNIKNKLVEFGEYHLGKDVNITRKKIYEEHIRRKIAY